MLAMLYRKLFRMTDPSAMDIGGCLILLQSWELYRMSFLASISHQLYVFPPVNRWSTNPGIGRSYTVPIYHLMIENHAEEGNYGSYSLVYARPLKPMTVEWYHGDRVLRQFGCIQYIPTLLVRLGEIHGINRRGKHENDWGEAYEEYITM
ncbi:serine/threonine-protein phosphatase 7 long form-like protein [Gossypium australe]|uniref:Serine/threonine-protein phosphatase 7 long form-like protein n=1 Tax=Gossypium australe TaxID=47621 RepID=A0A5B6VQ66_9ROSI|nr:serine/threonine-protein phosphatase 7 long form-like protein [Gossypium australe]